MSKEEELTQSLCNGINWLKESFYRGLKKKNVVFYCLTCILRQNRIFYEKPGKQFVHSPTKN